MDRYNLAVRLEKFGDQLLTACEKNEAIENRIDVCNQIGAVCRIAMTLKALRIEARGAEPEDAGIAGSAVSKYAAAFRRQTSLLPAGSGGPAEAASDPFLAAADDPDPFADSDDD